MTWRDAVRNCLMGSSYEEVTVVGPIKVIRPLVPVTLEAPEPLMALEEAMIIALRRADVLSDAPVMSPQAPSIRAARFRESFASPPNTVEPGPRLQPAADAPVEPRPAPLLTSPEIDRAEKLEQRRSYQGLTPVMRKVAE